MSKNTDLNSRSGMTKEEAGSHIAVALAMSTAENNLRNAGNHPQCVKAREVLALNNQRAAETFGLGSEYRQALAVLS